MTNGRPAALLDRIAGFAQRAATLAGPRRWAAAATLAWVAAVVAYGIGFAGASAARGTLFLDLAFLLVTLALPVILVWIAAFLAEELARQRALILSVERRVGPLADALADAQATLARHGPAGPEAIERAVASGLRSATIEAGAPLERLLAGQARLEAHLAALARQSAAAPPAAAAAAPASTSSGALAPAPSAAPRPARTRPRTEAPAPAASQPDLPLLTGARSDALPEFDDLLRAFDFPRDADDRAGFQALERALRHRGLAQMLQAAEDVLTLLSQEGLYMDDLAPEPVDPAAWRGFFAGRRGSEIAGLGEIGDPAAVETARGLMKSDPIFRDTALFFQRRFGVALDEIAPAVDDATLARLADTRSGRAFRLMARASGAFD